LGVERFGQAGSIADLYREYGIDSDAVVDAVADVIVQQSGLAKPLAMAAE
jgi:pyruvate dehydrogenase E1 component